MMSLSTRRERPTGTIDKEVNGKQPHAPRAPPGMIPTGLCRESATPFLSYSDILKCLTYLFFYDTLLLLLL